MDSAYCNTNIIILLRTQDENVVRDIAAQCGIYVCKIIQNVFSNYVHVYLYSKTTATWNAIWEVHWCASSSQLSISYHNAMQSGRLQSKIMRDVEQIETLSRRYLSLCWVLLWILQLLWVFVVMQKPDCVCIFRINSSGCSHHHGGI